MNIKNKRHVVTLSDLTNSDIENIVDRGVEFASGKANGIRPLEGKVVGIYFRKTSTRTRTSFTTAALNLGAQVISYGPNDLQENTGESAEDTAKVLSRMLDGFVARTAGSKEEMNTFASQNTMAVVNAMTEDEHPTQALADLTTLKQQFGKIENLRILYVGEGNNTAAALALSIPRFSNTDLIFATPEGYGVNPDILKEANRLSAEHGSQVREYHDLDHIPAGQEIDVIYTTRWQTTGTSKPDPNWKEKFIPFTVTKELMLKYPKAIFMHDLPAHRGEEVESEVIDGVGSIVFNQAENKKHSAMAVLEWCMKD